MLDGSGGSNERDDAREQPENARGGPATAGGLGSASSADRRGVAVWTALEFLARSGEVIPAAVEADPDGCSRCHRIVIRASDANNFWSPDKNAEFDGSKRCVGETIRPYPHPFSSPHTRSGACPRGGNSRLADDVLGDDDGVAAVRDDDDAEHVVGAEPAEVVAVNRL